MDLLTPLAGFLVGVLVGFTGVGGGALMTPILVLLFGVAPASAVGTDLWFAAITKLAGGAVHHRQGRVDWPVVRRLALGSLPASVLTLLWLQQAGLQQIKQGLMLDALGAVLLLALYPRRMTPAVLVGTDIVHAIPLTLVAGTGHLLMGHVDWPLLAGLLVGSIPGVLLGSLLGGRVAEHWLRLAIAVVLVGVGTKLLVT